MRYTSLYAARKIAELDQELAMFNELFTDWLNEDGNRERLDKLNDSIDYPNRHPLKTHYPKGSELVAYLTKEGMFQARFGDLVESEEVKLIEEYVDWLSIGDNRERLAKITEDLGDWNRLLIEAFTKTEFYPIAIWSCFASYRIRQLTSKALSKIYFSEEEGSE